MKAKMSDVLKLYRRDGHTFKYVNLRWFWLLVSAVLCLYFIDAEITKKSGEYADLKERCSGYVEHPVELPMTSLVADILPLAQEEKERPGLVDYHYLNPAGRELGNFDSLLLMKAGLEGWSLYFEDVNGYNRIALFNAGYHLVYGIDAEQIIEKTIGSRASMYFDYKLRFAGGKVYALLTWAPEVLSIYFFHGFYLVFMSVVTFLLVPILGNVVLLFIPGFTGPFKIKHFLAYDEIGRDYDHSDLSRVLHKKTRFVFHAGGMIYLVG